MDDLDSRIETQIPSLRRYAFALVRDHAVADDLVQDTLERALSRWFLRRRDGDLRAWLFAILRNLYLSHLRRAKRHGTPAGTEDVEAVGVRATQDAGLGMRDLLSALDRLSEEHRSVLLLVAVEDLSYEEVGRVLDIPVGTVMSRLSRARQRLRGIMETGQFTFLRRVK